MQSLIIEVDRFSKLELPKGWTLVHPRINASGPFMYNVRFLQNDGYYEPRATIFLEGVSSRRLYCVLKKERMLAACLGFEDLKVIKEKGVLFFCRHFLYGRTRGSVFGWKTVVRKPNGYLAVPRLDVVDPKSPPGIGYTCRDGKLIRNRFLRIQFHELDEPVVHRNVWLFSD